MIYSADGEEGVETRILRDVKELVLNAQQLVVLCDAVGAAGRAGLDLPGVDGHGDVRDRGVLGLAGAVADDGGIARAVCHLDGVQRLGQRADLVDLDFMITDGTLDVYKDLLAIEHSDTVCVLAP